jgi:hypothetical protein
MRGRRRTLPAPLKRRADPPAPAHPPPFTPATGKTLTGLAYDPATKSLVATLADGTKVTAGLSQLLADGEAMAPCQLAALSSDLRPAGRCGPPAARPCAREVRGPLGPPAPLADALLARLPHPANPAPPAASGNGVSGLGLSGTKLVVTLVNGTQLEQDLASACRGRSVA